MTLIEELQAEIDKIHDSSFIADGEQRGLRLALEIVQRHLPAISEKDAEIARLRDAIATLTANALLRERELERLRRGEFTNEELQAQLDAVEPAPLSKERIEQIAKEIQKAFAETARLQKYVIALQDAKADCETEAFERGLAAGKRVEREACAKLVEGWHINKGGYVDLMLGEAIRARGEPTVKFPVALIDADRQELFMAAERLLRSHHVEDYWITGGERDAHRVARAWLAEHKESDR